MRPYLYHDDRDDWTGRNAPRPNRSMGASEADDETVRMRLQLDRIILPGLERERILETRLEVEAYQAEALWRIESLLHEGCARSLPVSPSESLPTARPVTDSARSYACLDPTDTHHLQAY